MNPNSKIEITSFVRDGSDFVPIKQFDGTVSDPEHLEGAIELYIDGQMVSCIRYWDDVNWLWGFLLQGVGDLARCERWSTSWPDQPIRLAFTPVPMDDLVKVERSGAADPDTHVLVDRLVLMSALLAAAAEFFEFFGKVGGGEWANDSLQTARELQNQIR